MVRVGVTGGDLDIPEVDADIEHGRDEGMTEHMRVGPGDPDSRRIDELVQAACGGMPVHPCTAAVEQDRSAHAGSDRPADGWRQRDQDDCERMHPEPTADLPGPAGHVGNGQITRRHA